MRPTLFAHAPRLLRNLPRLLLLDVDGVLVDSRATAMAALKETYKQMRFSITEDLSPEKALRHALPVHEALLDLKPDLKVNARKRMEDIFKRLYASKDGELTKLYPGVLEALCFFHQQEVDIVAVSGKEPEQLAETLSRFQLRVYFSQILGGVKKGDSLNDKAVYHEICGASAIPVFREDCLMVGDSAADIKFAAHNGLAFCWVNGAYGLQEDFEQFALKGSLRVPDLFSLTRQFAPECSDVEVDECVSSCHLG